MTSPFLWQQNICEQKQHHGLTGITITMYQWISPVSRMRISLTSRVVTQRVTGPVCSRVQRFDWSNFEAAAVRLAVSPITRPSRFGIGRSPVSASLALSRAFPPLPSRWANLCRSAAHTCRSPSLASSLTQHGWFRHAERPPPPITVSVRRRTPPPPSWPSRRARSRGSKTTKASASWTAERSPRRWESLMVGDRCGRAETASLCTALTQPGWWDEL